MMQWSEAERQRLVGWFHYYRRRLLEDGEEEPCAYDDRMPGMLIDEGYKALERIADHARSAKVDR
jgi:hypothetical protein